MESSWTRDWTWVLYIGRDSYPLDHQASPLLLFKEMNTSTPTPDAQVQDFLQGVSSGVELQGWGCAHLTFSTEACQVTPASALLCKCLALGILYLKIFARLWNFISWPKFVFSWLLVRLNSVLYAYGPSVFSILGNFSSIILALVQLNALSCSH